MSTFSTPHLFDFLNNILPLYEQNVSSHSRIAGHAYLVAGGLPRIVILDSVPLILRSPDEFLLSFRKKALTSPCSCTSSMTPVVWETFSEAPPTGLYSTWSPCCQG